MDDKYYAWTDTVDGAMDGCMWMDVYFRWMINIMHGQIL